MKHRIKLIPILLFALISCKSSIQKKVIGKWKGLVIETNHGREDRLTHESEFTEDGKVIETNFDMTTGNSYSPVVSSYNIKGDSIIWIDKEGKKMDLKTHIEFISETRLAYKSVVGGDIVDTYDLKKISK